MNCLRKLMTTKIIDKHTLEAIKTRHLDNIILIDKPATWSSFDVVKKIKNIGKFKKVGHAGTLDPFATGLLLLGTNKETKSLTNLSQKNKAYQAKMVFGKTTDTFDVTGNFVSEKEITDFDIKKIRGILQKYLGESDQLAPMYSAKKVDGVRLYKLARKGREIERKPHKIKIFEIKEISNSGNELEVIVDCSKGTYIRTLTHDIGQDSGYGAYLKELRRLKIDDYQVSDALSVGEFEKFWLSLN
jgi:tRNA pseudouridine55 synthase